MICLMSNLELLLVCIVLGVGLMIVDWSQATAVQLMQWRCQ